MAPASPPLPPPQQIISRFFLLHLLSPRSLQTRRSCETPCTNETQQLCEARRRAVSLSPETAGDGRGHGNEACV